VEIYGIKNKGEILNKGEIVVIKYGCSGISSDSKRLGGVGHSCAWHVQVPFFVLT
jgi:hypothetical protein